MNALDKWWGEGDLITLPLRGSNRQIFVRRTGSGRSMTLLHGFPSCSHDWTAVVDALPADFAMLMPDLLGFGASEKPADHQYTMHEQADLVEALWSNEGITSTIVVAHDYAATVAQELLARRTEGRLAVDLAAVHLLNGGIYPDLHRPEPVQFALLDPVQGPQVSAGMTAEALREALRPTFAPGFDFATAATDIWSATARGGVILHQLIAYIPDRKQHESRWVGALESTDVPLSFTWGMLDPVSGAHIGERIRQRLPHAGFTALDDVGHWPPIEAPDRVAASIRRAVSNAGA
ncbi:MAG TPA: alpha/beta hydrolase [Nocardioidaceae bacterium]|nr:alpha/beta hydrolase [Nocardioidaceae bacterium]